jgi:hypothetical protein
MFSFRFPPLQRPHDADNALALGQRSNLAERPFKLQGLRKGKRLPCRCSERLWGILDRS